jgi:16S rRNA processing protein RimM
MTKTDCFQLGYIAKLHGYKGEVSLFLDVTDPDKYFEIDAFFLEIDDNLVPFMVESVKQKGKGHIALKLEGVNSEADATKLLKKSVYLPESFLEPLDDTHFYDHEVIGFKVVDISAGEIGILEDVFDSSATTLLQVMKDDKEILIPMVPNLVQKVDRANKTLHIQSPEGLLEIYS